MKNVQLEHKKVTEKITFPLLKCFKLRRCESTKLMNYGQQIVQRVLDWTQYIGLFI